MKGKTAETVKVKMLKGSVYVGQNGCRSTTAKFDKKKTVSNRSFGATAQEKG